MDTIISAPQLVALTKHQIQSCFATLGYTLQLDEDLTRPALLNVSVTGRGINEPLLIGANCAYRADLYERHRPMFELCSRIRGITLADTGKKIA
jgi:hypothetical protein